MTVLKRVSLGQDGIHYVRSCLEQDGALAARINRLVGAGGIVFAPLPQGVGLARAKEFEVGGLLSRRDTMMWLMDHLTSSFRDDKGCQIILEDIWMKQEDVLLKPNNPAVQGTTERVFFHDSKVYYFLDSPEISRQALSTLMDCVSSFLLVGFIISPPVVIDKLPTDRVVSDQLIEQLAQNTQEVFVSAYDQEGIVIWQRQAKKSK